MLRIAPFLAAGLILGLCVTVAIFLIVERGRLTVDSAALQQQRQIAEAERDGMLDALAQQAGALPQLALAAGLGATGDGARGRLGDLVELWRRNHAHSAVWAFKDGAGAVAFQKDTTGPFSGMPAGSAAAFLKAARAQSDMTAQAHYLKIGAALYRAAYVRSDVVMREMPAAEFLVLSALGSKPEKAGAHAGGLPGLAISAEPPPPGAAVPILDATGAVIGSLRWRPLLPGHAMIAEVGPAAIPLVIVAILAFLLLARVWIRQSDRVRDALAQAEVSALSERTKAMFFANLSHELRTPLNAIIGFAETMKMEIFGPIGNDRYASYTGDIHSSARHLLQLIDNVLIFTRSEVDHSGSTLEPVCLTEILDSARTILAPLAEAKHLNLVMPAPARAVRFMGQDAAARQIVINLVGNAIKFTSHGAVSVTADIAKDGKSFSLRISDTGIGIPAAKLKELGQPFVQVENVYRKRYEGAGLGLSIVKSIVQRMGGSLVIDSIEGRGTTVAVRLPVHAQAADAAAAEAA